MIRPLYFHNPNQEGFEAIIKHLHSKNYKFISIEELYSRLEKRMIPKENWHIYHSMMAGKVI